MLLLYHEVLQPEQSVLLQSVTHTIVNGKTKKNCDSESSLFVSSITQDYIECLGDYSAYISIIFRYVSVYSSFYQKLYFLSHTVLYNMSPIELYFSQIFIMIRIRIIRTTQRSWLDCIRPFIGAFTTNVYIILQG